MGTQYYGLPYLPIHDWKSSKISLLLHLSRQQISGRLHESYNVVSVKPRKSLPPFRKLWFLLDDDKTYNQQMVLRKPTTKKMVAILDFQEKYFPKTFQNLGGSRSPGASTRWAGGPYDRHKWSYIIYPTRGLKKRGLCLLGVTTNPYFSWSDMGNWYCFSIFP